MSVKLGGYVKKKIEDMMDEYSKELEEKFHKLQKEVINSKHYVHIKSRKNGREHKFLMDVEMDVDFLEIYTRILIPKKYKIRYVKYSGGWFLNNEWRKTKRYKTSYKNGTHYDLGQSISIKLTTDDGNVVMYGTRYV